MMKIGAKTMRGDPQQLDRLRESANDGARNFRTVYTFYLIVSLYILVVVSSTDHELLFRAGDVQMPIINARVSVVWFFTAVPWILLILHFNLLIQVMFLSRKINRYVSALDRHVLSVHERTVALDLLFPLPLAHKPLGLGSAEKHSDSARCDGSPLRYHIAALHSDLYPSAISPISGRGLHLAAPLGSCGRRRPAVVALATYRHAGQEMA